jgi:hypothetical protein
MHPIYSDLEGLRSSHQGNSSMAGFEPTNHPKSQPKSSGLLFHILGNDYIISIEILLALNQIGLTRLTKRGYDRVVLRARCGSKNQWLKIDPRCSTEIALHWVKSLDRKFSRSIDIDP